MVSTLAKVSGLNLKNAIKGKTSRCKISLTATVVTALLTQMKISKNKTSIPSFPQRNNRCNVVRFLTERKFPDLINPVGIYLLRVNFEHISHLALVILLLTLRR